MLKVKQSKSDDWKSELRKFKELDEKNPRRIVVIAPVKDRDKRRVLLIHPSEGITSVDVAARDVDDLVREVASATALLVDLAALGAGPMPPPAPPPGPIGDDVIYGSLLSAVRTMATAADLINIRVEQNQH